MKMKNPKGTNLSFQTIQPNRSVHTGAKTRACGLFLIEGGISGQSDKNKKYAGCKFIQTKKSAKSEHARARINTKEAFLGNVVMLYHAIPCNIMPYHASSCQPMPAHASTCQPTSNLGLAQLSEYLRILIICHNAIELNLCGLYIFIIAETENM
jgi:hypothetical protein